MMQIRNIQALRGIAVLFVVLFHIYIVEKKYSAYETLLPDIFQVDIFGVDLFFVISGFIMVTVTKGKFQDLKQSLTFLGSRLTRIYPLYWFYTSLALIVFLIQPSWVNSSQGNQVNIIESFLLLPSDKLPLVQVGWTLIHEIYFYLVYFFIFLFFQEKFLMFALLLWGGIITFLNFLLKPGNAFIDLVTNPLTIEFIGGCILAILYYQVTISKLKLPTLLIIVSVSFLIIMFGYHYYYAITNVTAPFGWSRVALYGIPSFFIIYGLVTAEQKGFIIQGILSKIGDASYSIYLSHLFTINVVGRAWVLISIDHWLDNIIFILLTLVAVLLFGFLSYQLIEKKLIWLSRRIINQ